MIVKVIGKQHLQGTSKAGKDYNLNIVHIVHKDPNVIGLATEKVTLDAAAYPIDNIFVDKEYSLDYGPRGYIMGFELCEFAASSPAPSGK